MQTINVNVFCSRDYTNHSFYLSASDDKNQMVPQGCNFCTMNKFICQACFQKVSESIHQCLDHNQPVPDSISTGLELFPEILDY
jgi:hypothetical protein